MPEPNATELTPRDLLGPLKPQRPVEVTAPGVLVTSRLFLRPLIEADRAGVVPLIRQTRATLEPWMSIFAEGETDDGFFTRQLERTITGERGGIAFRRGAFLADGSFIGCVNLTNIARGLSFEADMHWWIVENYRGKGYGTEAVQAVLDYALAEIPKGLGLHKVQAIVLPGNVASERLATRVGFTLGGKRTQASAVVNGQWERHDLYVRSVVA
ncbi:MAG: GNAT family N-acetyltransferase [Phycisphaerales bacterium]|nr:GNAT family N-acetyltransferase [Phycisphaerales bacterium]